MNSTCGVCPLNPEQVKEQIAELARAAAQEAIRAAEIKEIAHTAAKSAVKEWLLTLGISAATSHEVIAIQKDFATLRAVRESAELIRRRGIAATVTVMVSGVLGIIWYVIKGH